MRRQLHILLLLLAAGSFGTVLAQDEGGTVETVQVWSRSIVGNLQGNSALRDVIVYLPPSYHSDSERHFPVVYQLHGWLPDAQQWSEMIALKQGADQAIVSGEASEMIVVLPDAMSVHGGAMYSTSETSGDYEGFIARDVVSFIDANYRTLATRESRGLSGHSMGGYGTMRIAMKYPELWSSFYAMSSCCLAAFAGDDETIIQASQISSLEEAASAAIFVKVQMTQAAAWSPNPNKPPLYFDLPYEDGQVNPQILAKWNANTPLAMLDQYIPNLRQYDAIGLEVGLQDGLSGANHELSDSLTAYGIEHEFSTYEGGHTDKVAERFEAWVMPFFSRHLQFD